MANLVNALEGMFDGGDMTIFQATIDAVGQGILTIHYNGGTFTDVPYLAAGFALGAGVGAPSVGQSCYVIGRKGWGLLVIGNPAPGPERTSVDSQTYLWEPTTLGQWTYRPPATTNPFSATGSQNTHPDTTAEQQNAVWFYTSGNPIPPAAVLATASLRLGGTWTQPGPFGPDNPAADHVYMDLGLHNSNPGDAGPLNKLTDSSTSYRITATPFGLDYFSIPIDWMTRLRNGTAKGIYAIAEDYPMVFTGSGELRLTTL
jgi:hypothetical protein